MDVDKEAIMIISDVKLCEIKGGGITATLLNAFSRGVNTVLDFGRTVGTSIYMIISGKRCR